MTRALRGEPAATLPPLDDPRVPWRARMLRKAAAARSTARRFDPEPDRVDELRATVERERIAHNARYHNAAPDSTKHEPPATRAEQVQDMLTTGMEPAEIVAHLGIKPGSVVRALERAGRTDLIAPFERLRRQADKKLCPKCEAVWIWPSSTGCRPCANAAAHERKRSAA